MQTIEINANITLIASEKVVKAFLAEKQDMEWEAWATEWLANPENWDDPCYSDIFKDVYGVRPRW